MGQNLKKKSCPKNSSNEINQFHGIFFLDISDFLKVMPCGNAYIDFYGKYFKKFVKLMFLISRVFSRGPFFFLNFRPTMNYNDDLTEFKKKCYLL